MKPLDFLQLLHTELAPNWDKFTKLVSTQTAVELSEIANDADNRHDAPTGPLLPEDFPPETFQKIKRSALHPELLRLLQIRAWFTAGNPYVNTDEQIEKEFFICGDELDFIRHELYNETHYEAAAQADELKKISVSYFHIIDQ